MTVEELIKELQILPQDWQVLSIDMGYVTDCYGGGYTIEYSYTTPELELDFHNGTVYV